MPKVNDLTIKQRLFLKYYLDPKSETFGNGMRSALKSYDTDDEKSASVIATENLIKLRKPVMILMEKKGIGLGKLLDVLADGLEATRTISAVSGKNAKGTDMDFIDVPDYSTRHKYLETAGNWLGLKEETPQTLIQQNFNIQPIDPEEMKEFIKFRDSKRREVIEE